MCGKNGYRQLTVKGRSGSPPRVREKPQDIRTAINTLGITPACAGKTPLIKVLRTKSWDHPRVCGKNLKRSGMRKFQTGSPPRVREKLECIVLTPLKVRITPACAGKTLTRKAFFRELWDHPRVCGKNFDLVTLSNSNTGSPPRVREKPRDGLLSVSKTRITPACAGKTLKGPNEIKTFLSF